MSLPASSRIGPSRNRARLLGGLVSLWLLAAGCGNPQPGPTVGGNTNWLRACSVEDPCEDPLECQCGACTKACRTDADCEPLADARCVLESDSSASALCGTTEAWPSVGMCRPRCQPGECPDGQVCALLACVPLPEVAECIPMTPASSAESAQRDELIDLVERARLSGGTDCGDGVPTTPVAAVRPDARLFCAARLFADDVAANRGRSLIDSAGRSTSDRLELMGYSALAWVEGFGVSASSPAEGWSLMLGSIDFCSHFADPSLADIGVALSDDVYVVTLGGS